MNIENFLVHMIAVSKNYNNNIFNPSDKEQVKMWYGYLQDIDDSTFEKGIAKLMSIERFAPNIAVIRQYCGEVGAPLQVEATEGWGLVIKSIQNYGYMRAEEAMASLPPTVREAVRNMGGFISICESDELDVMRGQFNRTMTAINARELLSRKTASGLQNAMLQLGDTGVETKYIGCTQTRADESEIKEGIESVEEVMERMGLRKKDKDIDLDKLGKMQEEYTDNKKG